MVTGKIFIGSDDSILSKIGDVFLIDINVPIRKVSSTKCLGVNKERLSWNENTDYVRKKILQAITGIKQARPFISNKCDVVWDNMSAVQAGRVITQKVTKSDFIW